MVSPQEIQNITKDYVKKRKNVENVEIIVAEQKEETWIVKGTCPIDVAGHPWMEKFEIIIDQKGKIKDSHFGLV
jgi:hypothetical protein